MMSLHVIFVLLLTDYFITFATDVVFCLQLYKEMCNQSEAVVKWLYMQSKV